MNRMISMSTIAALWLAVGAAAAQDSAPPATQAPDVVETTSAPGAPEAPPSPAAAAANGPAAAMPTVTEEGSATVVFFRPSKLMGAALGFKVRENGVELGKLRNGKYFQLKVAPGVHQYEVHGESKDLLTLEVEAGQTYYVQGVLGVGILAGRPNLTPSDAGAFEAIKAKLKEVPPLAADDQDAK